MRYPLIVVVVLALAVPCFAHGYKQRVFVQQQAAVYAQPVVQQQVYQVQQVQVQKVIRQQAVYAAPVAVQAQVDYCPPAALAAPAAYGSGGVTVIQQNVQPKRRGLLGRVFGR